MCWLIVGTGVLINLTRYSMFKIMLRRGLNNSINLDADDADDDDADSGFLAKSLPSQKKRRTK